mmetsp:Transcript_108597/g.231958  ORF Transcript_108597/g.231958 Transcript_108597/m.231958 type:complete len:108 (-) Transcript_108597:107-430(-)
MPRRGAAAPAARGRAEAGRVALQWCCGARGVAAPAEAWAPALWFRYRAWHLRAADEERRSHAAVPPRRRALQEERGRSGCRKRLTILCWAAMTASGSFEALLRASGV